MSQSELLSYAIVASAGVAYWAWHNGWLARLLNAVQEVPEVIEPHPYAPAGPTKPGDGTTTLDTERWVATLLALLADLQARGDTACADLVRHLIWRLIGGPSSNPDEKSDK